MSTEATMRYDPEREVIWVWPDKRQPFLVSLNAIEDLSQGTNLSEEELLAACREHEATFDTAASRKRQRGETDPDGRVVVTTMDVSG